MKKQVSFKFEEILLNEIDNFVEVWNKITDSNITRTRAVEMLILGGFDKYADQLSMMNGANFIDDHGRVSKMVFDEETKKKIDNIRGISECYIDIINGRDIWKRKQHL